MRKLLVFAVVILVVLLIGGVASHAVLQHKSDNNDSPVFTSSYSLNSVKTSDLFVVADTAHLLSDSHVEADAALIGRSGVTVDGQVDGDLTVMSGSIVLYKNAHINGDTKFIGNSITLQGRIDGDLKIVAENLDVDPAAQLNGDLDICANHLLHELPSDLSVRQCGADELAGWQSLRTGMFTLKPFPGNGFSVTKLAVTGVLALAFAALSGLIVSIFPRRFGEMTQTVRGLPGRASRVGCLTQILAVALVAILGLIIAVLPPLGLVLMPILALLMLPLGILFLIGWMTIALLTGDWLLRRFARRSTPPMLTTIAGSVSLFILWTLIGALPYGYILSGLMALLVGAVGFGAAIVTRVGSRSATKRYFVQG